MAVFTKGHQKRGGRRKGTPNKTTIEKAKIIAEEMKKSGRRLGIEILEHTANQFYQLGLSYAPNRERGPDDKYPANEKLSVSYLDKAATHATALAPFQTPKLQSTTLRGSGSSGEITHKVHISFE